MRRRSFAYVTALLVLKQVNKSYLATADYKLNHLYIISEQWYQWHVPSTSATVNTHANVFFVFLPGGISKEWQRVSANCDFEGETGPIVPMFTGLSMNTWETAKIAHESHNDIRRLCWCHVRSAGRTWPANAP